MVLDIFAGVSISALKPVIEKVSKALVTKVNSKLNPSDLQKALQGGLLATKESEEKLPQDQRLFYRCLPDFIPRFLEKFFQETTVQQELQKPLTDTGTPKVEYLVEVFQKVAQTDLKEEYTTDTLEPWLEVFTQAYLQQTSTYLKFQVAKEDYFRQLAIYFDDIKFAGIAVEGQEREKSERLEQIFVMPEVKEETVVSQIVSDVELGITTTAGAPHFPKARLMPSPQLEGRKFSAEQLLSQTTAGKLVILGDPGIGKTTLMSYFAVMLARKQPEKLGLTAQVDWLPILLRIRDLARVPDMGILEFIEQFAQKNLSVATLPVGFFEHWLKEGKALILLDGLDEVANPAKREEIVDKIRCFLGQFQQNRAIITSRPAGYRRDFFHTTEFPHYWLQKFDEEQIQLFIEQWYNSRIRDPKEAQRCKDSLKEALEEQQRIQLLAQNPLLLTIIALIHRYEAYLPRKRYKLYDRAVKTLLTNWEKRKDVDEHWQLEYLTRDDLERLMQRLAYWIHCQGDTGDKEGGTLIEQDELISQLSKFIAEQKRLERYQAKEEAKRFLLLVKIELVC